jgi:hypothetical protein
VEQDLSGKKALVGSIMAEVLADGPAKGMRDVVHTTMAERYSKASSEKAGAPGAAGASDGGASDGGASDGSKSE